MAAALKLGILGSGRGSNFLAIDQAISAGTLEASIKLVASDLNNAPILEAARDRGLATYACPSGQFKTKLEPEIEQALAQTLLAHEVDLVVLAGFMRVVKTPLLEAFPSRIINIHPSLLPDFKGLAAWKQALEAGVQETGCTVHWVDDSLDGGPIIDQARVPVLEGDTPESLHSRIQTAEHTLFPDVLQRMATGKITIPTAE
ncbi:MAG: phosphoribosylglycinamide formyltransferase [Verrucomicrobiota bacterium]